jgi:hypothetical protein
VSATLYDSFHVNPSVGFTLPTVPVEQWEELAEVLIDYLCAAIRRW